MKRKPPGPGKLSKKVRAARPSRAKARAKQQGQRSAEAKRIRADEALQGSRTDYRLLFNALPTGILLADPQGQVVEANAPLQELTGYSLEELKAVGAAALYVHPEERERLIPTLQASGRVRNAEVVFRRKDGSTWDALLNMGWLELGGRPLVLSAFRDITGRKQAVKHFQQINRALKMLSDCSQALVRATEEAELLREMCRILVEQGGYRMAWIGFKEDDLERSVRPVAQAGYEEGYLETLKITWADTERGRGPTGTAIRTGRPATCRNMLLDPKFKPWRAEALKRGYASSLVLPLSAEGQVFGALNVYAAEPEAFGAEEFTLLAELADNLAFGIQALRNREALARAHEDLERRVKERTGELSHANELLREEVRERQRAEEAVRTAAEEWRKTFDAIPDLILLLDPEHRIVRVNQATAKTLGRSPAELVGVHCFRCVHGTEAPIESCPHARTLSDGQEHTGEVYEASLGRHFLVSTTPLFGAGGKLTGSVHVMRDITARKQSEEEIRKSEQKYRTLYESSVDGVVSTDLEGHIADANQAYLDMIGYTLEEARHLTYQQLTPAKWYEWEAEIVRNQILVRGFSDEYEKEYIRKDGTVFPVSLRVWLVRDDHGQVVGMWGILRDITGRKQAEEELKKHRERLEELVQARTAEVRQVIKDLRNEITERKRAEEKLRQSEASLAEAQRMAHLGNWDWNIVTNELRWSDEIYRIFGLTPREFGATYEAFLNSVHPEDRELVNRSVDQALNENQPYSIEHRIVLPAGEVRVVQERAEVTFDPAGKPIRMIGTVQDITERKRAEEARDKAERELEEQRTRAIYADRLRSLGEMAAGIAHELNQPLLGVRGLAEHILIGTDRGWDTSPDKIKEKVNLIVEQSDRMTHIIERVRMFARGADNSELMPVQVNDVIRSGTGLLGAQARARGMTLECELMENLPEVLANPFSLEEVILNLINNARDATSERLKQEPGSVPPRIVLRTRAEPEGERGKVVIDVKDQGMGIPPEILNRIFDPFFTTKAPDKGTGLGLSISKSIVESLGGMIEVQSAPAAGTTVSVSLPALTPGWRDRGKEKESP